MRSHSALQQPFIAVGFCKGDVLLGNSLSSAWQFSEATVGGERSEGALTVFASVKSDVRDAFMKPASPDLRMITHSRIRSEDAERGMPLCGKRSVRLMI